MKGSALKELIANLPKTETHLHMEGALPWELLQESDPDRFSTVPAFRMPDFRYDSFQQFESILIDHALLIFKSAESYYEVAKRIFEKHLAENVRYVEISFHAGMMELLNIPGEEILRAIRAAVPEGLAVRIFLGISRNAYSPYLGPRLEQAISKWDDLAGIDLHGLESLPMEGWTLPYWEKARSNGLSVKAHAGEFGPAGNVSHAIDQLGVRRVQHGIRAVECEDVLRRILDSGTTLDVCPISNYKLRVVKDWTDHPLKQFLDLGISCTISTDDPFSFHNTLCEEYMVCIDKLRCSIADIGCLARMGFEVADMDLSEKHLAQAEISEKIDSYLASDV